MTLQEEFEKVRQTYEPSDHSTLSPYEASQCVKIAEAFANHQNKELVEALEVSDEYIKNLFGDGNMNLFPSFLGGAKAVLKAIKNQK